MDRVLFLLTVLILQGFTLPAYAADWQQKRIAEMPTQLYVPETKPKAMQHDVMEFETTESSMNRFTAFVLRIFDFLF